MCNLLAVFSAKSIVHITNAQQIFFYLHFVLCVCLCERRIQCDIVKQVVSICIGYFTTTIIVQEQIKKEQYVVRQL